MDSRQITIRIDPDICEAVYVEPAGPGLYRLEDTPVAVNQDEDPFFAGDVIEVQPLADGTHQVVRVAERGPMRHFSCMVPRVFVESGELERFGAMVEAEGGSWESAFGGLLWVHLPPASTFDPGAELSLRIAAARSVEGGSSDGHPEWHPNLAPHTQALLNP